MDSPPLDVVAQSKPNFTTDGVQEDVEDENKEDAKEDEHDDKDEDDEDAAPLENKVETEEEDDRGPFEQYVLNKDNVAEKKRLPYIMMMFKALGFNFEEIHPYSEMLNDRGGRWVRSLKATKDLVAQELLRQNPRAKLNKKNQTYEQLSSRIRPLTDSRDIEFVMKEERKIRQKFYGLIGADWSKDGFINKHANLTQKNAVEKIQSKEGFAEIERDEVNDQNAVSPKVHMQKDDSSLDHHEPVLCPENKRQKTTEEPLSVDGRSQAASDCAHETLFPACYNLSSVLAEKAMHAAIHFAVLREWKITVAIVDAGGSPILVKRLDGASSASYDVALGRAKNAARFIKSTGEIEKEAHGVHSVPHDSVLTPFLSKRGGCPILISDGPICIGAIGVSGAPTATNDEQVANAGVTFITCMFISQKR